MRVDLTDPAVIEIIHVVAAAGFSVAFTSGQVLQKPERPLPAFPCDVGTFASLYTVQGFKRCVVVDTDGDDIVCVLLDDVDVMSPGEYDTLCHHDLLLVNRQDILHPDFVADAPRYTDVVH